MALGNTTQRVIVSIVAIPLIIAASYFGGVYFFIFTAVIALVSYYEFSSFVINKGIHTNLWMGMLFILLLLVNEFFHYLNIYYLILALTVLLTLIELFRNKGSAIINIGTTLLGILYIGFFADALLAIREIYPRIESLYERGGFLIISILAAIWICDSAAFFGGSSLGKHKLYPRVSPKKSWEGAIFGFIFAVITMLLAKVIILDFLSWASVIILGIIIGTIGQIGDLIESLFKRDAGVKDSSGLIPGHGGIFDRFDSLLYTAPVILIYLKTISL
ncbi:MAG TPA: phosphatidate cytidylyltransferase [Ignavibacteriaceae bacterium]